MMPEPDHATTEALPTDTRTQPPNEPQSAAATSEPVREAREGRPSLAKHRANTQVVVADLLEQTPAPTRPSSPVVERREQSSASPSRPSSPVTAKKAWLRRPPSRTNSFDAHGRPRRPSEPVKPTLAATAADLKSLVLALLHLIPFVGPEHPFRRWLRRLLAPPTRRALIMVSKVLHKRGVLAGDLVYDLAVLLFKVRRSCTKENLTRRSGSSTSSSARSGHAARTTSPSPAASSSWPLRMRIRCVGHLSSRLRSHPLPLNAVASDSQGLFGS